MASERRSRNIEGGEDAGITGERRSVKSERREGSLRLREGSGLRRKKRRHGFEALPHRKEDETEAWKTHRERERERIPKK